MAVAFRSATSGANGTDSVVLAKPSGVSDGDVLIAAVAVQGNTVVSSSGWTKIDDTFVDDGTAGPCHLFSFYKVASGEGASWTFSWSGGTIGNGCVVAYTGANTAAPINVSGEASTLTAPAVTTTMANAMVLRIYGITAQFTGDPATITAGTGTERANGSTNTTADTCIVETGIQALAGASATCAATGTGGDKASHTVAIAVETTPAISITSPADASATTDTTPDFVLVVTDADAGQTLTITEEIYSDSGLTTLVQTLTTTQATPAAAVSKTLTPTALARGTYYWRAKVSDGTNTSSWTTTRSFTVYYTNPTVNVTTPIEAASITGGPNMTVAWTTTQAEGRPQATYRVRLQNDAGSTTHYDSGVLSGTTASLVIDLVANAVPTDTADIKAVVDVTVTGAESGGTDSNGFDVLWGVVTTTITSPADGSVTTDSTPDITFTFASTRSKTMTHYRVVVTLGSTTFYDSGWVSSSASPVTVTLPQLSDNSRYTVTVTHKNSEGVTS